MRGNQCRFPLIGGRSARACSSSRDWIYLRIDFSTPRLGVASNKVMAGGTPANPAALETDSAAAALAGCAGVHHPRPTGHGAAQANADPHSVRPPALRQLLELFEVGLPGESVGVANRSRESRLVGR